MIIILTVVLTLFTSCAGGPNSGAILTPDPIVIPQRPEIYSIEDYKGKAGGEEMPEWAVHYLERDIQGVENLEIYRNHFVFVSRKEGSNFNALNHWAEGFSPELDFPRLAAVRIEKRFLSAAPLPDNEYGTLFLELIRAASDAAWTGATTEDNFWMLVRKGPEETETWEFLILVAMEKFAFAYQLDAIFRSVFPLPPPTREQFSAFNRVRDRFYEGF